MILGLARLTRGQKGEKLGWASVVLVKAALSMPLAKVEARDPCSVGTAKVSVTPRAYAPRRWEHRRLAPSVLLARDSITRRQRAHQKAEVCIRNRSAASMAKAAKAKAKAAKARAARAGARAKVAATSTWGKGEKESAVLICGKGTRDIHPS